VVQRVIREKRKQSARQSELGTPGNRMWYREYLERIGGSQ